MKRLLTILLLFSLSVQAQFGSSHIGRSATTDTLLYGYNGVMNFSGRALSDPELLDSLKTLPLFSVFRYPGGNFANSFDWRDGLPDDNTGQACTLSDVKALVDSVGCDILFVLNMLTKTMSDQLEMLAAADALGIQVKYVELGNEFNNVNNPGHITFPTPQDYADEAEIWRDAIKAVYPSCKVAFIGENRRWAGGANWNAVMLTKNPDALTWHESPNLDDFATNGVADLDRLNTVIMHDFAFVGMNLITTVPIWITESNYTYEEDNLLEPASEIQSTLFIMQKLSELIAEQNTTQTKIFCVRGIEGQKQGAYIVTSGSITRNSTFYAMDQFRTILISGQ